MTLAKTHPGPNNGKRKFSTLELLLVAGFILFLAYMSLEPLVLPAGSTPATTSAEPAAPLQAAASSTESDSTAAALSPAAQAGNGQDAATTPTTNGTIPVFVVTANSTVLERIAPIATVSIVESGAVTTTTTTTAEAVAVPPSAAPDVPAVPDQAKRDAAPASAPVVAQSAPVVAETPKPTSALRLEISDATGVEGLANNVAKALEKSGMSNATVVSVPAGKQRRTVILFRDGFEGDARRLGKLFVNAPALVRTANESADVKLILGSAAAREKNLIAQEGVTKLSLGALTRSH